MTTAFVSKYGPWALITGASEGIGKGFARHCAQQGLNLLMIARREDVLETAAQEMRDEYSVEARTLSLDLTSPGCMDQIKAFSRDAEVGILVNNAAFSFPSEFLKVKAGVLEKMLNINVNLSVMLNHHFGGLMTERGNGAIINVSSKTGIIPMPYFAMYSASKSFLSTLSEALWYELKDSGVDVLALEPCQTATEGYLRRNPTIWGEEGIQTVEDCVNEAFSALGQKASWLPWPPSRGDVEVLRAMPLEDAISRNGDGMKEVFGKVLDGN